MPSSSRTDNNNNGDADTFKILVSTDNHLGYNEECPIRAQDSFNSFEEVLQIAQEQQVGNYNIMQWLPVITDVRGPLFCIRYKQDSLKPNRVYVLNVSLGPARSIRCRRNN